MNKKSNPQSESRFGSRKTKSKKPFFQFKTNNSEAVALSAKRKPASSKTSQFFKELMHEFFFGLKQNNQNTLNYDWLKSRHVLLIFFFLLILISLLVFRFSFFNCHFFNNWSYCQTREVEIEKKAKLNEKKLMYATPRKNITDRNGEILAMDLIFYHVVINPRRLNENLKVNNSCSVSQFYKVVQPYIQDEFPNYKEFQSYIAKNKERSYKRAGILSLEQKEKLESQLRKRSPGKKNSFQCEFVNLDEFIYKRNYPFGESVSSLIGFVGLVKEDEDNKIFTPYGQKGIEQLFESELTLNPSYQTIIRSVKIGQVVEVNPYDDSERGQSEVELSLDMVAQNIVYQELKNTIERFNAEKGAALLIDGETGEVLALASYPSFNPDDSYSRSNPNLRWNHVYQSNITPGSTMKPFVLAAAYETNVLRGGFEVDTENERIFSNGKRVVDSSKSGVIGPEEVVIFSSNVGIVKMIRLIEQDKFANFLMPLHLAENRVFGFKAEAIGDLKYPYEWRKGYYDYLSTGYSLTTTLSHIVRAYSVFVNEGRMVDLTLRKRKPNEPISQTQIFQKSTIDKILPVLKKVVDEGTGTAARIPNMNVYGKTGTSQLLERVEIKDKSGALILNDDGSPRYQLRYANNKHRAIFVGFLKDKERKYIMGVYVDEPKGYNYYGGSVAAPVFAKSLAQIVKLD